MLFLRTLPNKYSAFVDNKKLQSEKLDDCAKLYEAAVAWSSTADKGDEADTTGKAMFGSGYDASSAEPGSKRTKTACYGCGETGHYKHAPRPPLNQQVHIPQPPTAILSGPSGVPSPYHRSLRFILTP